MVDYNVNLPQLQQVQAPNMLSIAEHMQKMQTSNMLMQQRAREVQKENALADILGRSGGKATPDVIKGLIASGNYEPALALQRHAASMGSIGVNTQAAQTALEKSRLELGETKRTLASNDAARNFIIQNEDLTNPEALTKLRQVNPDAFQEIAKFNTAMNKAQYEAAREGRLSEDATLKLFKSTAETFAPLIASSDEQSFYPLYDRLAKLSEPFAKSVPREFTPQNVNNIVKIAEDLKNANYETVGGVPGIVDIRSGTFKPLALSGAGTNAMLNQQTAVTPSASPASVAAAQPATPQTMEQFLAAGQAAKIPQEQALAEARARGTAEVTREEETKTIAKAKEKVSPTLAGIVTAYKNLAGRGELISAEGDQTLMQRAKIGTLAALPSKVTTVLSPKTGSDITTIENLRRDLIPTIIEMTGAKAADAVAEMNSILNSLTTPGQADASVVATLNNFGKKYGLGELLSLEDLRPAGQNAPGAASESGVPRGRRGAALPAAPAAAAPASAIPPAAISKLKADPSMAPQFDEIFGVGAAARVMGR
tara:strand:+ start:422 stop:2041 length:1620 start_codon:yes stop_codon:yes gene_type:complete